MNRHSYIEECYRSVYFDCPYGSTLFSHGSDNSSDFLHPVPDVHPGYYDGFSGCNDTSLQSPLYCPPNHGFCDYRTAFCPPHSVSPDLPFLYECSSNLPSPARRQCGKTIAKSSSQGSGSTRTNKSIQHPPSATQYKECEIDLESVKSGKNQRLTIMLRNVPNRYSESDLCRVLDSVIPGRLCWLDCM